MSKITIITDKEFDMEELAYNLADELRDVQDAVEFFNLLEKAIGDWDVLKALVYHFNKEYESAKEDGVYD